MRTLLPRIAWLLATVLGSWLWVRPTQAAPALTLDEVLDSVERTHPKLEAADRKVEQAQGKAFSARGGFDPTLTINSKWAPVGYYPNGQFDALVRQATPAWGIGVYAGYRLGWGDYPSYKGELATLSGGELRAGIDVPIWRDGPIDKRRAKIQQTRILTRGAEQTRDATQLEVERKAASAYWKWVAAGQQLQVARDLLAIAEFRDAGLNEQAAAGAIERIKLVDNRRLVLDRMSKVVDAERKFQQASLDLSLYLRDEDQQPIRVGEDRVPDAMPEPERVDMASVDREVEEAMQRRPDVAALLAEREASEVGVRLAKNQRAPKVNVQSFVAKDFGVGWVGNNDDLTATQLGPVEFGAGLKIEMPLPLREARGQLQTAKAELGAVDAELRGLRDAVGAEIRAAFVALQAAEQTVELARQQVSAADELADAERTRFREGGSDLVIVNLREQAAANAASKEIDALANYQRAHVDFLVSTGRSPST